MRRTLTGTTKRFGIDDVHQNVGGDRNFDARYLVDGLDRLTRAEEGTLTLPGGRSDALELQP